MSELDKQHTIFASEPYGIYNEEMQTVQSLMFYILFILYYF